MPLQIALPHQDALEEGRPQQPPGTAPTLAAISRSPSIVLSLQYTLLSLEYERLYTNITVDLLEEQSLEQFRQSGIHCDER